MESGFESLLPSHSYYVSFLRGIRHFTTNRQTENLRQLVAILVILCDINVIWGEVYFTLRLTPLTFLDILLPIKHGKIRGQQCQLNVRNVRLKY